MGRNIEVNKKMKDVRKEKILSSALKLFSTMGLSGTKISDIAKESGSSQGLVYHYFKSKDDIYTELITNAFKKLNEACLALEEMNLSADEKIRIAVKKLLEGIDNDKNTSRTHLLIASASVSNSIPNESKKVIRSQNTLAYQVIARIMKKGQKEGNIRENNCPEEMSTVFWASIKGLAISKAVHVKMIKMPSPEIITNMFIKEK